jgi:hypothetical protein
VIGHVERLDPELRAHAFGLPVVGDMLVVDGCAAG